jgi:uncharacterized hydrophobic protein (TIGR00271 family)
VAEESPTAEVQFSRELGTRHAVARSLAILIALALFTLQGRAMTAAGPSAALSYLLWGVFVSLTLLCYVELFGSCRREGGAYLLLRESTRGPISFLTGWAVLLGGLLLCAVLALGFAATVNTVFQAYLGVRLPEPLIGVVLTLLVAAYNVLGGRSHRGARDAITSLAFASLLILCVLCLPRLQAANYQPFSPHGYSGIQAGLSLMLVGFLALEAVPLSVSEIRRPRLAIPQSFFAIAGLATLLLVTVSLVAGGLATPAALGQAGLPVAEMARQCLGEYGRLAMLLFAAVFIPLAMNSSMLWVVRQAQVMDRDGVLPQFLRRRTTRWGTPHVLLLSIGSAAALLCLAGDVALVARCGGFCALFVMGMVALGDALRLRSLEEEPAFRLPVRPLLPALALVVDVFLVPAMGAVPVLAGAIWLAAGLGVYFAYARGKLIEGQEGVVVFRSKREPGEARYRVLVPVGPGERASELIRLAVGLAGGEGGEVLALRVVTLPPQVPLQEGARMAAGMESVFSLSLGSQDTGPVTLVPVTRVARSVAQGIIDAAKEEKCDLILLSWEGYTGTKGRIMGHILDPVVENAPCDVVLVKGGGLSSIKTILLPTSGGPHASIAARVALKLARLFEGQVTVMYICREGATDVERQHGVEMINRTIQGLPTDDLFKTKVVTAPGIVSGILAEAQEYDLMLLGASEEGLFDRVLFGTIPERIAQRSPVPVMIVKQRASLPQFWVRRAWDAAYSLLPTLEAEERSQVYLESREGSRADADFYVMIALSAIIASLGLLLDSAAVIIGGMLVAPLMSPIIGIALSIALGNVRLLRDAFESTIKGVFVAVVVGLVVGSLSPLNVVTGEILARTRPDLLDLVVALASGAAGAYAISRKDVSAALPGVAIAAALVPPLGVVGIGLAIHRAGVAGGGLLLFTTNLVAIIFAGAMVFLLLGFRPARGAKERQMQVRRGLVISVLLLLVVSLPLALILGSAVQASQQREVIDRVLNEELDKLEHVSLVSFQLDQQGETIALTVIVYAAQQVDEATVQHLDEAVTEGVGRPVSLNVIAIPVSKLAAP